MMMSGRMPAASKLKNVPVRPQPTWMSSTISSMSWRLHSFSSSFSQRSVATLTPPSPCTVSTMTAAGLSMPLLGSSSMRSRYAMVSTSGPK
ncbi:hypothetical protein D3C77_655140 [compost metagenome]